MRPQVSAGSARSAIHSTVHSADTVPNAHPGAGLGLGVGVRADTVLASKEPMGGSGKGVL